MRKALLVLFAMLLATGAFANGSADSATIKIGVAGAHSGDLASYGLPSVNAAKLVVEKTNANGGINGKMLELVIVDDQCKPELATNAAAKLVSEGVVAVLGHICSGATSSALGIYADSNLVTISPSATTPSLTQSGLYPNFFRTIAPDDAQARVAVDFIKGTLKVNTLAVMHDKGDYGKGFADLVKEYAEADGISVILYEGVDPGAPDYSAVVNKIGNANPDAVVWGGYHPEASKLVQQMRDRGIDIPMISDDGVKDYTFIEVAGPYSEGVYATGPMDTTSLPEAKAAIEAHKEMFGDEPGAFFKEAYAAMTALVNAIEKAGSVEYEALTEALRSNYVDTTLGNISFDEKGDVIGFGFSIFQVQNGTYVEVK